jgi:hypothetical protein
MTTAAPDKWVAPNYASFTGSDAIPLQQTFQSLSAYLEKINNSVTIASGVGVLSAVAGTGISVSSATGAVTFTNTGVTGLTGTANQVTVSSSTGSVTLSLPTDVSITGKYTSTGNSQITMGSWTADTQWGAIEGSNGYLLMGRSSADTSIYLRGSNASGNIYIGANGNNTLTVGTSSASVSGNFTAGGVVTGSGGLVSNVFTTGVAYGSYGSVSLIGAGNNTYTGIANAYYSCAVMWNNSVFGHYINNSSWNFYFSGGGLNCISVTLSGGISAVGNVDIQNRYRGTAPNSGAYVQMRSGNAASWNWDGTYRMYVDSSLVKNFTIQHPNKPDNWLVHACAEGATSDVFYRGEGQLKSGICVVTLPDYFEALTETEGRSVMLTPIADEHGMVANLAAYEIEDGQFLVEQIGGYHVPDQRFWWRVDAVRKNTTFNVEPEKSSVTVHGMGPYTYIESNA